MPVDAGSRARTVAGDADVGEDPIVRLRGAGEIDAEPMAHGAVGAVAADQPGALQPFLAAASRRAARGDAVGAGGEVDQLDAALDRHAELLQMGASSSRSVSLCGIISANGYGCRQAVEGELGEPLVAAVQPGAHDAHAGGQERLDGAGAGEQLERARPQHQRLRLVGGRGLLSTIRQRSPWRVSSAAIVRPTGPAPTTSASSDALGFTDAAPSRSHRRGAAARRRRAPMRRDRRSKCAPAADDRPVCRSSPARCRSARGAAPSHRTTCCRTWHRNCACPARTSESAPTDRRRPALRTAPWAQRPRSM